jgi:endonuclease/exonuclease/phosphatase family metal-dependent hydrolase
MIAGVSITTTAGGVHPRGFRGRFPGWRLDRLLADKKLKIDHVLVLDTDDEALVERIRTVHCADWVGYHEKFQRPEGGRGL